MIILQACLKDLTYIQKDNWKAYSITGHVGKLKTAKRYKRVKLKLDEMLKILVSDKTRQVYNKPRVVKFIST